MKHIPGTKRFFALLISVFLAATLLAVSAVAAEGAEAADGNVAAIGDTEYQSLQAAVLAAADGDTVRVIRDHTITIDDAEDVVTAEAKRAVINVAGKTITMDFSGYTVTVMVNYTICTFIATTDGAHLTMQDSTSIGRGGICMTVGNGVTADNLVRNNDGSSITVKSGVYTMNASTNGSGMIDSRCTFDADSRVGVFIEGGHFTLGNIGTLSNGSPWLINTSGQNERKVFVSGGSFNGDILHQYYPFEVKVPETLALQKSDDGTYTLVPAVCWVNEQHKSGQWYTNEIGFASYEEGFARIDAAKSGSSNGYGTTLTLLGNVRVNADGFCIPEDKEVIIHVAEDLVIDGDFTIPSNATVVLTTAESDILVYGTLTNEGVIDATEEIAGEVQVTCVTDVDISGSGTTIATGSFTGNAPTERVAAAGNAFTTDGTTLYPMTEPIVDPVAIRKGANGATMHTSLADALENAEDGDVITVLFDMELGATLIVDKSVTITGTCTLTRARTHTGTLFTVAQGASLTLGGGLVIDGGNEYAFDRALYDADAENWNTAIPTSDCAKWFTPAEGAPVATAYMFVVNGALHLNDVTVQNNYSINSGVVLANANSSVELSGATIRHVAAVQGGGVAVNASGAGIRVTMNEGTVIDGNHVGSNHGIFKIYSGAVFTMNGGEITGTTGWNSNGVAIGMYQATVVMNGGTICSNSAIYGPSNGRNGAIYVHNGSTFTMNGGTICHNSGRAYGGVDSPKTSSKAYITGGAILDNESRSGSENADVNDGGSLSVSISGGTFSQDVSKWLAPDCGLVYNAETGTYGLSEELYAFNGNSYNTFEEALLAAKNAGASNPIITVIASHKVDTPITVDIDAVIDLNGMTITGAADSAGTMVYPVIRIVNGASVTVKNGEITSEDYIFVLGAADGSSAGYLTIESGKYHGNVSVASVTKGRLTVLGGEFSADPYKIPVGVDEEGKTIYEEDYGYLLNCIDASYRDGTATIVVFGGTFHLFNPQSNASEGEGTNHVDKCYRATEESEGVYAVSNACTDADKDHTCDYGCGKSFGEHSDADKDHACDYGCAEAMGECTDGNKDHTCDYGCGKSFGEHSDADKDHACDYGCAEVMGECTDGNKDHVCDYGCGKSFGEHSDADKDHACDYGCTVAIGECTDGNKDHTCDYGCVDMIGVCIDTNRDHLCDYGCGWRFAKHSDKDKDHACDYGCAEAIGEHSDEDKNHACDYGCAEAIGEHADPNKDHVCDYGCTVAIGVCVDADKDHICDYGCGKSFGEHSDADKDHACDYGCAKGIGAHSDEDKNHACDYGCAVAIGEHADGKKDHVCDHCGVNMSEHSYKRGVCTHCGAKDPEYKDLTLVYASFSLAGLGTGGAVAAHFILRRKSYSVYWKWLLK